MARNLEKQLVLLRKKHMKKFFIALLIAIFLYLILLLLSKLLFFCTVITAVIGVSFWILFSFLEYKQNVENVTKIDFLHSIVYARDDIEYCGNLTHFRDKFSYVNKNNYTIYANLIDNIVSFALILTLFANNENLFHIFIGVFYLRFTFFYIKIFLKRGLKLYE